MHSHTLMSTDDDEEIALPESGNMNDYETLLLSMSEEEDLPFADFRTLVRSVWPNNEESDIIRKKLWQLSTHIAEIPFIDGKLLNIEYNYNPWRKNQDCILINMKTLLPIFGKIKPPCLYTDKFIDIMKIDNFVSMHVHLNVCSNYRHYSCLCHLNSFEPNEIVAFAAPSIQDCKYGHPHHYCSEHVRHWLKAFLKPSLIAREENVSRDDAEIESCLHFIRNVMTF